MNSKIPQNPSIVLLYDSFSEWQWNFYFTQSQNRFLYFQLVCYFLWLVDIVVDGQKCPWPWHFLIQKYESWDHFKYHIIRMSNEGLCTKTGPLNCISYHLTRGSKYLFLQDLWQVYQNRSERHLMVFCIDRTTKACYDYIRIFGFSISYLMWLRFLSVCLKALSYRKWSNLRLTVSDLNYWYFYGTQGSFWTIEEGMGT